MVEVEAKDKQPPSFLNKYISDLKNNEDESEVEKELLRKKVQALDTRCL